MEQDLVSIVMSVYNTEEIFLRASIESILNQTYKNIEFIIIDDGCDLKTKKVLDSYNDIRIVLLRNKCNIGLTASLNIGLKHARGKYIARMDADDISLSTRIELQYQYMEKNAEVAALGTWVSCAGKLKKYYGSMPSEIRKIYMLFGNAGIAHPTAFLRREFLVHNNIKYDENIMKAQDYKLWVDIIEKGRIEVLPQVLLEYRLSAESISVKSSDEQQFYRDAIRTTLIKELYEKISDREIEQFLDFSKKILSSKDTYGLLNNIIDCNKKKKFYLHKEFEYEMIRMWGKYFVGCIANKKFDKNLLCKWTVRLVMPSYVFYRLYMIILKSR